MKKSMKKIALLCCLTAPFIVGCAVEKPQLAGAGTAAVMAAQEESTIAGRVVGRSNLAKTFSIQVGRGDQARTSMLLFDDKTTGLEFANKREKVTVTYKQIDGAMVAISVKLNLAELPPGVVEIKTDELKAIIDRGEEIFLVDSRPARRFNQAHLPGAVNIPMDKLQEKGAAILPKDKNTLLVFYCGGPTCPFSPKSAALALTFGYTDARAYLEGEPAWTARGFPLYASNQFVSTANIVLLDLRSAEKAVAGRIPRSVVIPFEEVFDRFGDIPRRAPIVLYSDNREEVMEVFVDLLEYGFRRVSLVQGNFQGWVDAGGELEKGVDILTEINWQRILGKGEITIADFRAAMKGKTPNVKIIDVRTRTEVAGLDVVQNAVNIPLDEIPAAVGNLPKDKKILINCAVGVRAELAYKQLRDAGFNVKFLIYDRGDI